MLKEMWTVKTTGTSSTFSAYIWNRKTVLIRFEKYRKTKEKQTTAGVNLARQAHVQAGWGAAAALWSPPRDSACTILGSALLPSRNSSSVSLSSWFLSIWSNILSTRFCGVFSSSAWGCCPYKRKKPLAIQSSILYFSKRQTTTTIYLLISVAIKKNTISVGTRIRYMTTT